MSSKRLPFALQLFIGAPRPHIYLKYRLWYDLADEPTAFSISFLDYMLPFGRFIVFCSPALRTYHSKKVRFYLRSATASQYSGLVEAPPVQIILFLPLLKKSSFHYSKNRSFTAFSHIRSTWALARSLHLSFILFNPGFYLCPLPSPCSSHSVPAPAHSPSPRPPSTLSPSYLPRSNLQLLRNKSKFIHHSFWAARRCTFLKELCDPHHNLYTNSYPSHLLFFLKLQTLVQLQSTTVPSISFRLRLVLCCASSPSSKLLQKRIRTHLSPSLPAWDSKVQFWDSLVESHNATVGQQQAYACAGEEFCP